MEDTLLDQKILKMVLPYMLRPRKITKIIVLISLRMAQRKKNVQII